MFFSLATCEVDLEEDPSFRTACTGWTGNSRIVLSLEQARAFQARAPGFSGSAILKNLEGIDLLAVRSMCQEPHAE